MRKIIRLSFELIFATMICPHGLFAEENNQVGISTDTVMITTNPFETGGRRKNIKYVSSDADVEKWGKWLYDPSLFPREEGAYWLGKSNNPKAIPYLLKALKDPEPSVRQYPAGYLKNFNDERIKPALMEALKTEKSLLVQKAIINSVKKIGTTSSDEKIIMKCKEDLTKELKELALTGKDSLKKIRAIWEIVNILNEDPKKYEDSVIKTLESDSSEEEKVLAIRLLEKTLTEKSTSALRKALNDKNSYIRGQAESTLEQLERKAK